MRETPSERRLAENEVVFRRANENAIENLNAAFQEEKDAKAITKKNEEVTLYFFCECADDRCKERIKLHPAKYKSIHSQSNMFIILPGHEMPQIEKVSKKTRKYYVVQKYMTPPTKVTKLHSAKKNMKKLR